MKKTIAFTMMATSLISMEAMASHFNDEMSTPEKTAIYNEFANESPFSANMLATQKIAQIQRQKAAKVAKKLNFDLDEKIAEEKERMNRIIQKIKEEKERANSLKKENNEQKEEMLDLIKQVEALHISIQEITDTAEKTAAEKQTLENDLEEKTQGFEDKITILEEQSKTLQQDLEDKITILEEQSKTLQQDLEEKTTALEKVEGNLRQQEEAFETQRAALERAFTALTSVF